MKSKHFRLLLLLLVLILILAGCSEYSDFSRGFYAGETITPDQIAVISAALATSDKASSELKQTVGVTEKKQADTDAAGNIIVYWTAGGSVWHTDRKCGSLANSSAVESGTIKEAAADNKDRNCMKCSQYYVNTTGVTATVAP